MAYFDPSAYGPQKSALDFSTGLSSLGDALTDVLNRRQKQREIDAKMALDKTQQDINGRKALEDTMRFRREEAADQSRATLEAQKYMGQGNPQAAAAVMHGVVSYDPATGAETGRGELVPGPARDVGPAPQAPVAPEAPAPVPPEVLARRRGRTSTSEDEDTGFYQSKGRPMPAAQGVDPLAPPEFTDDGEPPSPSLFREYSPEAQASREEDTRDALAEQQARMDAEKYGAEKATYDKAAADFPGQKSDYDRERTIAENERPYTLRFGKNDPGVTVDVAAQRYRARDQAAEDFAASLDGLTLDEQGKQAARAAYSAIKAGSDPRAAIKQFNAERIGLHGEEFKHGEGLLRDQAALERAQIAGPRGGDYHIGQLHEQQEAGTVRDMKEFQQDFRDWEQKAAGIPLQSKSYARLSMALKNINSGNGPLQRDAQSALVSYFSGGGVVREFEQKFLLSNLAGLGAQGETALEHLKSGKLGPTDLRVMQEATRRALQEQQDRAEELAQSAHVRFGPGSGYENFGGNVDAAVGGTLRALGYDAEPMYPGQEAVRLGDIVRPYRAQGKRPAGAPPQVQARDKAKHTSSLDDAMQ
jgi:hypothetical protein